MKRTLFMVATALLLGSLSIQAQDERHKGDRQEKRLEHMTKNLDLTPDQQTAIKAAFDEKNAKMEAAQNEFKTTLDAILTAEQKAKHEKMKDEMKDKKEDRRDKKSKK